MKISGPVNVRCRGTCRSFASPRLPWPDEIIQLSCNVVGLVLSILMYEKVKQLDSEGAL